MRHQQVSFFVAMNHFIYLPAIQMAIETNGGKLVGVQSKATKMSLDREIKTTRPEVLIISLENLETPNPHHELIDKIKRSSQNIKTIAIIHDIEDIPKLIKKQVEGLLLVNEDFDELIKAIKIVSLGESYYSPKVRKRTSLAFKKEYASLTHREIEVFILLKKEGEKNKDKIVNQLNITRSTLRSHISSIKTKLGTNLII